MGERGGLILVVLHRPLALAALALACAAATACRSGADAPPPPAPSASAAARRSTSADQVVPGELAEGTDQAFGLPIPRKMRVRLRFPDEIVATGEIPAEQVSNYVRQRVLSERVETGPAKTVFSRATLKRDPARFLRVEVISRGTRGAELVVRDVTRPPPEPGLSEEERWRQKGFKPDGTPLDPTRLE